MRTSGTPEQHVTSTGWRIVGQPAVSLLSATSSLDAAPSEPDDVVFAARFRVKPQVGASALDPLLRAIDAGIAGAKTGAGVVAKSTHFTDPASKFHSIVWRTAARDDAWLGELAWRRVHPAIAGVAITDHLVIEQRHGDLRLTLRTFAAGGSPGLRGYVGAGQARSPLLRAIAGATRLSWNDKPVGARRLHADEVDGFIRDVLLDDRRQVPVAVLSATDANEYIVAPDDLAGELLGVADVYYLDEHRTSFNLTDGLGDRRLSCFFGAMRVYQAGFSCSDDGLSHPLLLKDRLSDPVVRSGLAGSLALLTRSLVPVPAGVVDVTGAEPSASHVAGVAVSPGPAAPVPVAVPLAATPATPAPVSVQAVATAVPVAVASLPALESAIRLLADQIAGFQRANVALMDEIARLRTTAAVRAANTANVDRRLADLERMMRDFVTPSAPAEPAAAPVSAARDEPPDVSLADVVQQAMAAHSDALLVLEQAVRAAEESPYEDIDRVAVILDAMAFIARRRQADAMGQSLRDTFREFGIDYRGGIAKGTSSRHRQQYIAHLPGGDVLCEEHIALGSSQDPRHCLRIYFTSRAPGEPRFVIAHVGRHFDVATTT
jgi:hypothetical protein